MSTFTVSEWKDAFKTQLEARGGLTGVTVFDAETPMSDTDRESIVLGDWTSTTERITYTVFEEEYVVTGEIRIWKPDTAKTARDRALAVLKEIQDELVADPTTTAAVFDAMFLGYEAEEDVWPDGGRICTLEFEIEVKAHQ